MSRNDITITDATTASTADLCAAMAQAFSDYTIPFNLTVPAFRFMMKQRGLSETASRIALIDGQIAAIWLVSVRANRSYLISSGTLPEHRGQGLATALAHAAIEGLRKDRIASFQTEVLVENKTAARLYSKLGMTKSRDLSCYTITGPTPHKPAAITDVSWANIAGETHALQDWPPSWQNSNASITAIASDARCFCTRNATTLTGYAVLVPDNGRLLQIGVRPDARRQGIGTALINHALNATPDGRLGLINADAADPGFAEFVRSFPCEQTQGQFELIMPC